MTADRRLRILTCLVDDGRSTVDVGRLCSLATDLTGTSGAGVVLVDGLASLGSFAVTDEVSAALETMQFTLGEGPSIDASVFDAPVIVSDLAARPSMRWLSFGGGALELGVAAVFAFPVRVGAARLRVLTLYRDRPGELSDDEYADALVVADLVAEMILLSQAHAPPGVIAEQLEEAADFHAVVHQASGMVAAQLDVGVAEALVRLRAYAIANDRSVVSVSRAVVGRTLRLPPAGGSSLDSQQDPETPR